MIGTATETYDIIGAAIFVGAVHEPEGERRFTRTATLDGGCAVYDTGYSDSDRIITILEKNPAKEMVEYAEYLVKNYKSIIIAMKDGCYRGVPSNYSYRNDELTFKVAITEKIST